MYNRHDQTHTFLGITDITRTLTLIGLTNMVRHWKTGTLMYDLHKIRLALLGMTNVTPHTKNGMLYCTDLFKRDADDHVGSAASGVHMSRCGRSIQSPLLHHSLDLTVTLDRDLLRAIQDIN